MTSISQIKAFLLLSLLIFTCHGLLLLNDGVTWDGWVLYGLFLNHDTDTLVNLFRESGIPATAYLFLTFWWFSNPIFAYKLTAFLCIILSTFSVYCLIRQLRLFTLKECLFIAALFSCYSAYQTYTQISALYYEFYYALFLIGICLLPRVLKTGSRTLHTSRVDFLWRVPILAIFFVSFQLGALLVFYFPLLTSLLIIHRHDFLKRPQPLFIFLLRYIDFLMLPFVFWLIREKLWKPYGHYVGYNEPRFDPRSWYASFHQFFHTSISDQFLSAWRLFQVHPMQMGILVAAFLGIEHTINNWLRELKDEELHRTSFGSKLSMIQTTFCIALFCLVLLLCAMFPFIAVGKIAAVTGSDTRFAILVSLPVAILIAMLGRFFVSIQGFSP